MFINSFKRDSNSYSTNLIISMFLFLEEKIAVSCSTYVFNISESIIWTGKSEYTTWTCLCPFQSSDLCFYVSNLLAPLGRKYARPLGKAYA